MDTFNATMDAENGATMDIVETKPTKPKRGRGGTENFPGAQMKNVKKEAMTRALLEVVEAYKQPRVRSDEELMERTAEYFKHCAERGSHPVLEEYALFLGYASNNSLCEIENGRSRGFSPQTKEIIRRSKFVIQALDAKLAIAGDLNFLAYCFRAKNFYGMADKVEHVLTNGNAPEEYSRTDIAKKYMLDSETGAGVADGETVTE